MYDERIRKLREDKITEVQKKHKRYGYLIDDDLHTMTVPEGYSWRPVPNHENGDFYGYTGWQTNYAGMVDSFPAVVCPYSSMAGNFHRILLHFRRTSRRPEYDYSEVDPLIRKYDIQDMIGQVNHYCGDVSIGLKLGWGGILKKVRDYAALNGERDAETKEFYEAEIGFVETVIGWIRRTSEEIEAKLEQETDALLKDNLREMLRTNRHIETEPPRTLREACQFLCWYNMVGRSFNGEAAGYQLDEVLRPYYERDKEAGLIDDEDAIYYLVGLILSETHFYQIAGPGPDGKDVTSRISWLILEAADRLDVSFNLTINVCDETDINFVRKGVEMLFKHRSGWPRFAGADALIDGYIKNGYNLQQARSRVMGGCQWLTIPGREYTMSDCSKINLAKVFEVAFNDMMAGESLSVEKLWEMFEKHLRIAVDVIVRAADIHLRTNRYNCPELFLNLFSHGPIEKGTDVTNHSVDYYNFGIDGVGIAVAADSFAALEQRVEKEGRVTWQQVKEALDCNYSGEMQRVQMLMKTAEKYGQGINPGLKWVDKITKLYTAVLAQSRGEEGERFTAGLFSWRKFIEFGRSVGATPDGRLAGTPLNQGVNPMPGVVKNGEMTTLSESILTAQCGLGNTSPFQLDLDPTISAQEGGIDNVTALIMTHLKRGGTLINVNILDREKVLKARENPEQFPDLVVRVTGYTAYFLSLSPQLRDVVVDRILSAV